MNKVILMGRLTKEPEVKYLQNEDHTAMARYTLAVERRYRRDGKAETDFISCVAFGKNAEFAEKYLKKGLKIAVSGRIQTGSYINQDGDKVYATNVVVEDFEGKSRGFADGRSEEGFPFRHECLSQKKRTDGSERRKNLWQRRKHFRSTVRKHFLKSRKQSRH